MYTVFGKWYILPGNEKEVTAGLKTLAKEVKANEPGAIGYMANLSNPQNFNVPPAIPGEILFFEVYKDAAAFQEHLKGKAFNNFLKKYGHLLVSAKQLAPGEAPDPYITVETVDHIAGFMTPWPLGKA